MMRIDLPETMKIIQGPKGLRFKGPAFAIRQLASSLRNLRDAPLGLVCTIGQIEGRITLPREAWNILASKFLEVATGREESPFDFGDCGYLHPIPVLDIGIELVGEPVKYEENS